MNDDAIPEGISHTEWARRIIEVRFRDAIEELLELDPPPSQARIELVAASLGISGTALAAELESQAAQEADGWCIDPLNDNELAGNLTPPWLVENYLYRDLAVFAAPGGSSKTTLALFEAIHIALGRPLYGLRTCTSTVLYVTGEEQGGP